MNTPNSGRAIVGLILATALFAPLPASAAVDGKTNLICAVNGITACDGSGQCSQGTARAFDVPQFIAVDFADKEVRTTKDSGEKATSAIKSQHNDRNQLLLQGFENGHGWTMAIDTRHGRMTTSATGEDVSYLMFGACIAR